MTYLGKAMVAYAVALAIGSASLVAEAKPCPPRQGFTLIDNSLHRRLETRDIIGKPATPFQQIDVNKKSATHGKYLGPQNYKGKVVVLNFWAEYCEPCLREFPYFEQVQQSLPEVQVLALESDAVSHWERVQGALSGVTFPVLGKKGKVPFSMRVCSHDNDEPVEKYDQKAGTINNYLGDLISRAFYGTASQLPVTVIIDQQQVVREVHRGVFNNPRQLEALVRSHLK